MRVCFRLVGPCEENHWIPFSSACSVPREIPLFGFYLQPSVGGVYLPYSFWEQFVQIPNLIAIMIAPFNRYQTLDVIRAVSESGRTGEIALYTGNDDHIVLDLLSESCFRMEHGEERITIRGGLLGLWACWTRKAVSLFEQIQDARAKPELSADLLSLAGKATDYNEAFLMRLTIMLAFSVESTRFYAGRDYWRIRFA